MGRTLAVLYGVVAYAVFLFNFLYAIGFVGDFVVPKTVDSEQSASLGEALIVNMLLLGLFAVQHSVMARPAFKRRWTRLIPEVVERSTYVLLASLILLLLYWQWRPIPQSVWTIEAPLAAAAIQTVFWLGWGLVLFSTFLIDHFELFGLKQVFAGFGGRRLPSPVFKAPLLYRHTRHPLYLGFLLAFWATPTMTVGHLLFAIGTTGYILVAIRFEEHDLVRAFGETYRRYSARTPMLIPWRRPRRDRAVEPEPG